MNKKLFFIFLFCIFFLGGVLSAGNESSGEGVSPTTTFFDLSVFTKIGNLLGIGESDLLVKGVELTKGEEESTLTFSEGGKINLKGDLFENIEEGSLIKLDNSGEIKSANLVATEDTSFNFKGFGDAIRLSEGNRLVYENGKMTVYKSEGKETVSIRQNVFDESGNNIGKFMSIKMLNSSFDIEKATNGNILTGNFELSGGENKIKGLSETGFGKVTLSNSGRITEIGSGTEVSMKNVVHKVSGDNLKIYYDSSFDPSSHKGENYFNFAQDKLYVGGMGFTSNLGKSNSIFGDMKTSKYVDQFMGTKTRDFQITMNDGNLEISKVPGKSDLEFDIKGEGEYLIKNGGAYIRSERGFSIVNNKPTLDEEPRVFVKGDFSKGYSYNMTLNGKYTLRDNLFKDDKGNTFNLRTPWENTVSVASEMTSAEAKEIKLNLEKEGKLIYTDDPNFLTWLDNSNTNSQAVVRQIYAAADSASQNKYGVKVTPAELYGAMKGEGWGFKPMDVDIANIDSYHTPSDFPVFDVYPAYPDRNIDIGETNVGLSGSIDTSTIKKLENDGFIPRGIETSPNIEYYYGGQSQVGLFVKSKDVFNYFAGVYTQKKYYFERDFKKLYGEEEFNKLSDDEKYYWTTYYFNAGEGGEKSTQGGYYALKNRDKYYVKVWEEGYPESSGRSGYYNNPKFQSRLRTDFVAYIKELGLFKSL